MVMVFSLQVLSSLSRTKDQPPACSLPESSVAGCTTTVDPVYFFDAACAFFCATRAWRCWRDRLPGFLNFLSGT